MAYECVDVLDKYFNPRDVIYDEQAAGQDYKTTGGEEMRVILELDGGIPKCCHDCRLVCTMEWDGAPSRTWCCRAVEEPDGSSVFRDLSEVDKPKPDWCPLHPLPERKVYDGELFLDDEYVDGWNACLDAIGGAE